MSTLLKDILSWFVVWNLFRWNYLHASSDNTIIIGNVQDFNCVQTLKDHLDWIWYSKLVSSDLMVSGSRDGSIKICRFQESLSFGLEGFECIKNIDTSFQVSSLKLISKDLFVSGHSNGSIQIWALRISHLYNLLRVTPSGWTLLIQFVWIKFLSKIKIL